METAGSIELLAAIRSAATPLGSLELVSWTVETETTMVSDK